MQTGKIGVTTENIFPVIKKFLYSDHEIFLRELVSNAVDATSKLRTLSSFGEFKGDTSDLKVRVSLNADEGTLTVSDQGVGMTAEDLDKYINQIAFSGAEEFLAKYKDKAEAIIGHFGLGFYSAFMVARKVVVRSLSYKEGAEAVEWECDGSPEYTMKPCDKKERGTDIILYIDKDDADNKIFLQQGEIDRLLKKYCRFLPVPVISGKEQEWKDGKFVDTDRDKVVNSMEPLWTRKPADLTDENYLRFYHDLYPGQEDPMFWIHLNVDFPFTLTGVLFFPKIKNNIDPGRNRIQLYCNQVYVTDQVEGVVPEFMLLLQGVIDSPDIPLNVSRSYLQADTAVKKISGYITKKVSGRLAEIFRKDRADFEAKWDDIKIFIEYGMLTDDRFRDAARKFVLLKDTEGKYYTLDEYRTLVEATQTDKEGNLVYLYSTDPTAQYSYIKAATDKGYNVLVMDGQLDPHFIGMLEGLLEKTRFVRVDSDVVDNLIPKADSSKVDLTPVQIDILSGLFRSQIPQDDKLQMLVEFAALKGNDTPVVLTQSEYMRRMKEMAAIQPGMAMFGQMPDQYNLMVNTESPVVKRILEGAEKDLAAEVGDLNKQISEVNDKIKTLNSDIKDGKPTEEQSKHLNELQAEADASRRKMSDLLADYASRQPVISQSIDLALLANGLLKGEPLSRFIARSVELL